VLFGLTTTKLNKLYYEYSHSCTLAVESIHAQQSAANHAGFYSWNLWCRGRILT